MSKDKIDELHTSAIQNQMKQFLDRMLQFYGLRWSDDGTAIIRDPATFDKKSQNWLTATNHNMLRLTRILKSLRHFGLDNESDALFQCLQDIYLDRDLDGRISDTTFKFWYDTIPSQKPKLRTGLHRPPPA